MSGFQMDDNPALAAWLAAATRKLSTESAAQVREEIEQHFESAREEASAAGATSVEARRAALESLGDARAVNRSYRKVLLTAREARLLFKDQRSWPLARTTVLCLGGCLTSLILFSLYKGDEREIFGWALMLIVGGGHVFLPARTSKTGRIHRCARWAMLALLPLMMAQLPLMVGTAVALGMVAIFYLGPYEWSRMRLRQKLPVEQWPSGLFM